MSKVPVARIFLSSNVGCVILLTVDFFSYYHLIMLELLDHKPSSKGRKATEHPLRAFFLKPWTLNFSFLQLSKISFLPCTKKLKQMLSFPFCFKEEDIKWWMTPTLHPIKSSKSLLCLSPSIFLFPACLAGSFKFPVTVEMQMQVKNNIMLKHEGTTLLFVHKPK